MFSFTQNRNYRGGGNAFPAQLALYMSSACSVNSGWTIKALQFGCLISKAVWKNAYYLWIKNWEEHSFGITNYPFKHARLKKIFWNLNQVMVLYAFHLLRQTCLVSFTCARKMSVIQHLLLFIIIYDPTHIVKPSCWLILTPIMNTQDVSQNVLIPSSSEVWSCKMPTLEFMQSFWNIVLRMPYRLN